MKEDFLTNTFFDEFFSDIIKKMQEEDERKALAKVLENEKTLLLTDCGVIKTSVKPIVLTMGI